MAGNEDYKVFKNADMKTIIITSELNVSSVIYQSEVYVSDDEAIQINRCTNMIDIPESNVDGILEMMPRTGEYRGLTIEEIEELFAQGLVLSVTNPDYLECSICIRKGIPEAFGIVKRIRDHFSKKLYIGRCLLHLSY